MDRPNKLISRTRSYARILFLPFVLRFSVDHKSSKELRQYLGHIAEQASMSNGVSELPSVIILDNLHHASALGEVFQVLLSAGPAAKLPCIIGTMSQATCNTTNLQLHHNFRWVTIFGRLILVKTLKYNFNITSTEIGVNGQSHGTRQRIPIQISSA